MAYLNLDPNYFDHPKTRRLIGKLGQMADVLPLRLWAYCARMHRADGAMKNYSDAEVEAVIHWSGNPKEAIKAMLDVGFLKRIKNGLVCVDWLQHQAHLEAFSRRAKENARKRWDAYAGRNATSIAKRGPLQCSSLTIPNHTLPNQPDQTNDNEAGGPASPSKAETPPGQGGKAAGGKKHAPGGPWTVLQAVWNRLAHPSLPRCKEASGKRLAAMKARWEDHPEESYWEEVVRNLNAQSFCLGSNDRGWLANFDFLMRPESATKVNEGAYLKPEEAAHLKRCPRCRQDGRWKTETAKDGTRICAYCKKAEERAAPEPDD